MNNDLYTASNIHIYKPKRGLLALNIFSLFFFMIVMGIPLIAFVLMIVSFFRAEKELDTFAILFGCLMTPLIIVNRFRYHPSDNECYYVVFLICKNLS